MTRMNWARANDRGRIQRHGAESVAGKASGARPMPVDRPSSRPGRKGPTLAEPVVISKFWRSRDHSEHLRVELSEYEGHPLINVRIWQTGADGIDRPTKKGIALGIRKLPELATAIAKAETKARELGLLDGQDEAAK